MYKKFFIILFLTLGMALTADLNFSRAQQPVVGESFPNIILNSPDDINLRSYLGIGLKETFSLPDITPDIIIIQIYSMYCPICQREAPRVNSLYNRLTRDQIFKDKVRLIGIGIGNSKFEVDFYQKKYKVPFPLFPDGTFKIHKMMGEVRTPYFICLKTDKDGSNNIFHINPGPINNMDSFISSITRAIKNENVKLHGKKESAP